MTRRVDRAPAPARQPYRQLIDGIRAAVGVADTGADGVVDRATAMLAGRVGCRLGEARAHLARLAAEHGRDLRDMAAELLIVLETQAPAAAGERTLGLMIDRAIHAMPLSWPRGPGALGPPPVTDPPPGTGSGRELVQQVLDAVSGAYAWLSPVRDDTGQVIDFLVQAASPEAVDVQGRRGSAMVGISLGEAYPSTVGGPLWRMYLDVLADGAPRQVDPMPYRDEGPAESAGPAAEFGIRAHAFGDGLIVGWTRRGVGSSQDERIAQMERLANLGWGEWDLVTGEVSWSDELYRIYERDPALGPLSQEESGAMMLPEDQHVRVASAEAFARGETVDVTYRIRVGGRVKHLRAVIDAVRDGAGKPLRLYGIVQDVTSREIARARLATVERELRVHQQTLAAEHRLAAELQQIVLPIPAAPIDLPGLRVAVRYLPAERASRVGGDWYHAAATTDGGVLLAIGDVAGHGLQAATTMAQLRHAMAALAVTTSTEPAELLSYLNRLLCAGDSAAGTATAAVGRYDPGSGVLTWAQAGHPAPLRTRGGVTTSLPRPRGLLLGAVADARYDTATVELRHEDLLVFYTDGLVEDRKRSLEQGLAPVITTLNEISRHAGPAPLADLLDRLTRANPDDDTCVLAVRLLGHPTPRPGPGGGGPGGARG